ncbi:MAG: Maf family protein [Rhodanobacteraceae bacterium]
MSAPSPRVVLASTSRYRAELLRRLLADFDCVAPEIDETPLPDEAPAERASRLATAKASAVSKSLGGALVIGSDQVAELDGRVLRKPGEFAIARQQLRACSGREVRFHTAVCVIDARGEPGRGTRDLTRVQFRQLTENEIQRYLERERPFDCAGSFRAEGAGIALFERIDSEDPTALIGLPLIALARLLREAGLNLP